MYPEMEAYHCTIMRGGTSKGIFLMENELPQNPQKRDRLLCAIFGSPDIREIDGLGGADSLTSKAAIIGPSSRPDADVDYTFGQVSLTDEFVDYGGNCGNISSAVGPFAINCGLVRAVEPETVVRIHMTNTGKILVAHVPVSGGKARVTGDYAIDGVPGTGAKIVLDWSQAVGGCTGKLLPTGNAKDVVQIEGRTYTVSIVDAGNIVIFIRAEELGLKGTESAGEIDANAPLMAEIESIRGHICAQLGLVDDWREAATKTPYQPFFAIVSPPAPYACPNGGTVAAADIDFASRLLFMLKMHKTYPISGTIATGAAARVEGSVVWDLLSDEARRNCVVRIGHPAGVIPVTAVGAGSGEQFHLTKLEACRTARLILDGQVYVPRARLE
ncbi:MAG: PrpF domain-containing protein [Oscillospiraceae bacterium]